MIDNPKSKLDFGFGLSIQFCHFNPNPKYQNYFIMILKFCSGLCSNNEAKLHFFKIFKQLNKSVSCELIRDVSWEFYDCIIKLGHLIFAVLYLFSKNSWIGLSIHFENQIWIVNHIFVMDLDWIDNPKKLD